MIKISTKFNKEFDFFNIWIKCKIFDVQKKEEYNLGNTIVRK